MQPTDARRSFPPYRTTSAQAGPALGFVLLLSYLPFEFILRANTMRIPLVLSVLLLITWFLHPKKIWTPQIVCFLLFLAFMAIHVPFTENTYPAFWMTYNLLGILVFFCIPLIHIIDSLHKLRLFIYVWLTLLAYMGIYAIFHAGFGPAGAAGAQDENYVAASMVMVFPFAYFLIFFEKALLRRLLLLASLAVFIGATVVTESRGGMLGMGVVLLCCMLRSPKKWVAVVLAGAVILGTWIYAPPSFWTEMGTIGDTEEATADTRLEFWKLAFRMFLDYPILGVGPANFPWNITYYQTEDQYQKFGRALAASVVTHSLYFELLAEMGGVGAILFLTIVFRTSRDLRRIARLPTPSGDPARVPPLNRPNRAGRALTDEIRLTQQLEKALTASLAGFFVIATFLSYLYASSFWYLVSIGIVLQQTTQHLLRNAMHTPRE